MTGTTLRRIKLDFVNDYIIALPPLEIQKEFIEQLNQEENDKKNHQEFIDHQRKKRIKVFNGL
jgi:restriction endonuclease S subunit